MANDVYLLAAHYNIGNQPGMNVWHFRANEDASEQPDYAAEQLILGWKATLETPWLLCLPADVECIGYKARRVNNGGGPTVVKPQAASPGDRTGHFSAGAIGPCLIWGYQKLAGGWAAGRTFLPGVSEADIVENVFSDELLGLIDDFIDLMLASPTIVPPGAPPNFNFGIYSPTHSSISDAETGGVSGKPGIQNRRMKPSF